MSERALGAFDFIAVTGARLRVDGWMTLPPRWGRPVRSFRVELDGAPLLVVPAAARPEIRSAYPWHDPTTPAGFSFVVPWDRPESADWSSVRVVGIDDGGSDAMELSTLFVPAFSSDLALPPTPLRRRVMGNDDPNHYLVSGLKALSDFFTVFGHRRESGSVRALLDWGCGCGRLSQLIAKFHPEVALYGCDVDDEAVGWCRANITGRFAVSAPEPPTEFADRLVDTVLGYSVMSHLPRDAQRRWLDELARVTAPGGLLLLSVHGRFAAETCNQDEATRATIERALAADGISDGVLDTALDGVAPADYYRGVFQTEEYTREVWSGPLEVVEYIERGMGGFQDLVVLQKPS